MEFSRVLFRSLIAREDKQHDLSERNIGGFINMAQYFEAHSTAHARGPLAADLLGTMLGAEQRGAMTHPQVVGSLILLAIAANEPQPKLIGNRQEERRTGKSGVRKGRKLG